MQATVYSTTTCAFCKVEKQWLDSKGVKYASINIDNNEVARKFIQEVTGGSTVPVTIIAGTKPIIGFNRPALIEALGIE